MATLIGILGYASSGKTTAAFPEKSAGIKGLPPEQTLYVNPTSKPLMMRGYKKHYTPFQGAKGGNLLQTMSSKTIIEAIQLVSAKRPEIKYVVVDDASILSTGFLMSNAKVKGFDKYVDNAVDIFDLLLKPMKNTRDDLMIFLLYHAEIYESKTESGIEPLLKFKLGGKMIDNQLGGIECLFTIILHAQPKRVGNSREYRFITTSDGSTSARSPIGMFPSTEIPNDYGFVVECVNKWMEGEE